MKRQTFRRITLAIIVTMIAAFLSACGGGNSAGSDGKVKMKIGYLLVMDDAQAILADEAGIYEKHGLDVEMVQFSSGTDLIKGIVSGQLDAGVLGFSNALTYAAQGAGLKVVGGAQMGFHSIIVPADSDIESVEDLKGKRLASQKQGSTADIVLNGVTFAEAGLVREDVNMVYVSPAQAIQSLEGGAVDAAFVFEPFDKIATARIGAKRIYEIGEVWPFPCMVVITSDDVLKNNQEAVNRMLDAQKEAIEMLENEPAKAAEYLAPVFIEGDELETPTGVVKATEIIEQSISSQEFNWALDEEDINRMQELADIMLEQNILEKAVKVSDILDLSWQEAQL